jgi:hypothetical protein
MLPPLTPHAPVIVAVPSQGSLAVFNIGSITLLTLLSLALTTTSRATSDEIIGMPQRAQLLGVVPGGSSHTSQQVHPYRYKFEMIGVNAQSDPTEVIEIQTGLSRWQGSEELLPGDPVRKAMSTKAPVPIGST